MSENIDKDAELTEEELRQAAGGRQTARRELEGRIVLPGRSPQDKLRRHDGELDGSTQVEL